jgi:HSP20 family protein
MGGQEGCPSLTRRNVDMFAELVRWNPFDELFALTRQLDRHLHRADERFRSGVQAPMAGLSSVDVHTDEQGWHLRVAVPGIAPEDVDVQVAGQNLHIRAVERAGDTTRAQYEQTVTVPEMVDIDRISATCRHGLLDVLLPFKESIKPRRIEVATESPRRLSA